MAPVASFVGLGLGLSIVRQLVELHGGTVEATSAGRGRGAAFTIRLPSVPRSGSDRPVPPDPGPRVDLSLDGRAVLVVDDEVDSRFFAQVALEIRGARVVPVGSVDEAIAALAHERFDVVVSDIGMPERDGYELVRHVRGLPLDAGGRLPVVALTAYARSEDGARALRAGFHAHVPKPVEPAALASIVARLAGPA